MYGRDSRYYRTRDVTRVDSNGRVLDVDELRVRPPTSGTFRHTINADERLDHLAQRYYGKPRRWWLIADANPEFASPLAMLGDEPVQTAEFDVTLDEDGQWWAVVDAVRTICGVEVVTVSTEPASPSGTLTVRFNRATIPGTVLQGEVAAGIAPHAKVSAQRQATRLGRQLVIPPDDVG